MHAAVVRRLIFGSKEQVEGEEAGDFQGRRRFIIFINLAANQSVPPCLTTQGNFRPNFVSLSGSHPVSFLLFLIIRSVQASPCRAYAPSDILPVLRSVSTDESQLEECPVDVPRRRAAWGIMADMAT